MVMYAGNHSPCHPLKTLLEAAEKLRHNQGIAFCFAGGGSELAALKQFAAARDLTNIFCLPYQPRAQLASLLSAADLHVVIMGEPFVGIIHPCKIYNIMQVGAPFLYIGPAQSHVMDIVVEMNDAGQCLRFRTWKRRSSGAANTRCEVKIFGQSTKDGPSG